MKRTWMYLNNQFLSTTKYNYKKAVKLSNYHDAALYRASQDNPDPELLALYNRYHTAHLALVSAYEEWRAAGGTQQGETLNVEQQLNLLPKKVDRWMAQVSLVYEKTSPQYKAFFPNGKAPFAGNKEIQSRINAVGALRLVLQPDASVAVTYAEVDAFYTLLDQDRDTQEGAKSVVKGGSNKVDLKREEAMKLQYSDLGWGIYRSYENPEAIEKWFDVELLREGRQTEFTGTLDALEEEPVLVHTFLADDTIVARVIGTQPYKLYLASSPGGKNSTAITVPANNEKLRITISDFQVPNLGTHRYLTAVNESNEETRYQITLE